MATNHMNGVAANGNAEQKRCEISASDRLKAGGPARGAPEPEKTEQPEVSWLAFIASQLGELSESLDRLAAKEAPAILCKREGNLSEDAAKDMIEDMETDLQAQFDGLRAVITYSYPMDVRDCLILAITACAKADDLDGEHHELKRMLVNLVVGLEDATGETSADLGLQRIFDRRIADMNRRAVNLSGAILGHQMRAEREAANV